MDQFYFEEGYFEGKYFVYIAVAKIDLRPYIAEGYLDPDYFVYTGISSSLSAELTERVGVVVEASGSWTSEFTVTASITHLEGADLFAFSEAAIAVAVDRIRSTDITASSVFSIAIDYLRQRDTGSDLEIFASISADVERNRVVESQLPVAFSFDVTSTRILSASSTVSSSVAVSADAQRSRDADVDLTSTSAHSAQATRIQPGAIDLSSESTLDLTSTRIFDNTASAEIVSALTIASNVIAATSSSLASESSLSASFARTRFPGDMTSYFDTDYITPGYFQFVGLQYSIASTVTATITNVKSIDIVLDDFASLVCQGLIIKQTDSSVSSATTLSADAVKTTDAVVDTTAAMTLSADQIRIRDITATALSLFTPSLSVNAILRPDVFLESQISAVTTAEKTTDVTASITTEATTTCASVVSTDIDADFSTEYTLTATGFRTKTSSASFSTEYTQSTVASKTARTTADLATECTVSADINYITDNQTVFDSVASNITAAVKNTNNEVNIASTSSLITVIGTIKQLEPNANTGLDIFTVTSTTTGLVTQPYIRANFTLEEEPTNGLSAKIISVWVKKRNDPINGSVFESKEISGTLTYGALRISSGNIQLLGRTPGPAQQPTLTWSSVLPNDSDWHHLYFQIQSFGFVLYLDGINKGYRKWQPVGVFTDYDAPVSFFVNDTRAGDIDSLDSPYLAQFWAGPKPSLSNDEIKTFRNYFYDQGYVDLEPNGRDVFERLPEPLVYASLSDPWYPGVFARDIAPDTITAESADAFIPYPTATAVADLTCETIGLFLSVSRNTAEFTTVFNVTAVKRAESDQQSTFTQTCTANYVIDHSSQQTAQTQLVADVARTRDLDSALTTTADVSATVGLLEQGQSALASESTLASQATIILPIRAEATLNSTVTVTATVGLLEQGQITIDSAMGFSVEARVIPPITADAQVTAEFTLSTNADALKKVVISAQSIASITVEATLIPPIRAEATISATTALSASLTVVYDGTVLTASLGTLTVESKKFTGIVADVEATANITTDTFKFTGIVADLQAQGFVLTVGNVYNLDPRLSLTIKPETLALKILPETREIMIKSETRINTVY